MRLSFTQDAVSLIEAASKKTDDGDYLTALELLNRAEQADDLTPYFENIIAIERGDVFYEMELYAKALDEYFYALDPDVNDREMQVDIYYGIIACFIKMDLQRYAMYYFGQAINLGLIVPGDEIFDEIVEENLLDEAFDDDDEPQIKLYDDEAKGFEYMKMARRFSQNQQLEEALDAFSSVPSGTKYYSEARAIMGLLEFSRGDYDKASQLARDALDANEDSVVALTVKLFLLAEAKSDQLDSFIDEICQKEFDDVDMLRRLQGAFMQVNCSRGVEHFGERVLKLKPFDRDALFNVGIAAINLRNLSRAKDRLLVLRKIDPSDPLAEYYLSLAANPPENELAFVYNFTRDDFYKYRDVLADIIEKGVSKEAFENNYFLFRWALYRGYKEVYRDIFQAAILFKNEQATRLLGRKMVAFTTDNEQKKNLLRTYLCVCEKTPHPFNFSVGGIVRRFNFRIPLAVAKVREFAYAYWTVISEALFYDDEYENNLYKKASNMLKVFKERSIENQKVENIAAVLAHRLSGLDIFRSFKRCCEIFGASFKSADALRKNLLDKG